MSNRKLNLGTRLQGSAPFLEIQSFNSDNFTFDANSQVNLADSIVINDLTLNGNFINNGGGSVGGSVGEYTTSVTTPKIIFTDNLAEGLIIESSDGADYIVCNSTNGSEQINLKKKIFTDGNQLVCGTNGSRGILQYANIKNSTIDSTNTLSANTTGTSSAWNSAMRLDLSNPYTSQLMSFVTFDGSIDKQLPVYYIDESSSASHRFVLQNTEAGHDSANLQTKIEFLNQYHPSLARVDKRMAELISTTDNFSTLIYDSQSQSNYSEFSLSYDKNGDIPSIGNFVFFDTRSNGERVMRLENRFLQYDSTTQEKQYATSIHLCNAGDFRDTVVEDEIAKIKANWESDGIGQLKLLARKTANSSAQECGLIVTSNAGGNAVNQNQNTANMVIGGQQIDGITNIKYFNGCAVGNSGHLGNGLEYKDSGSSVINGDATGYDNTLELKIADDSLETSALGLSAKLKSSGGLETDTGNGLQVQLKTGGGLDVDANGLFVSGGASSNEITDADGSAKIEIATNDQIVVKTNSANRMLINDDGRFSVNNQFRMAYTTITAPNQAKVALSDIQDYLLLLGGGSQSSGGSVVSYGLGFGAVNQNSHHPPAYIKYDETNIAGDSSGRLVFGARSSTTGTDTLDTMWIKNGRVGIGVFDPGAPLQIIGYGTPSTSGFGFLWNFSNIYARTDFNNVPNAARITIEAEYSVKSMFSVIASDIRIKKDFEDVNDDEALNIINGLEIVKYNYKDESRNSEHKTIGFKAQQVNEVLPNAVKIHTDVLPDIMLNVIDPVWEDNEAGFKLIYDVDVSGDEYTGNVKFMVLDGEKESSRIVKYEDGGFVFNKQHDKLICIGREVNNYHLLNKDVIFGVGMSAIQELSRKIDLLMLENNGLLERTQVLEDKNTELENKVSTLETELEDKNTELENKISSLQSLINDLTRRVAINETTLHGLIN